MVRARSRRIRISPAKCGPNAPLITPPRLLVGLKPTADHLLTTSYLCADCACPCAVFATYFFCGGACTAVHAACD